MLTRRRPASLAGTAALALLAGLLVIAPATPAAAQDDGCSFVNGVWVCGHEEQDQHSGGSSEEEPVGPSGGGTCWYGEVQVPCQTEDGWYIGDGCYRKLAEPPPDQDPPDGADSSGAWYIESCYLQTAPGADLHREYVWLANGTVPPNPEELARRAMARISLRPPEIRTAPDPSGAGLVGLPVYLWIQTEDNQVWGEQEEFEAEAGLVVTVQAKSVESEWELGDGSPVKICSGPGTPYDSSFGGEPSQTCGHRYQRPSLDQPDGQYQITARTRWQIRYSSNTGFESSFSRWSAPSTIFLSIHELQVVTS